MDRTDEILLQELKVKINNCPKCFGTNLSCGCYQSYYFELAKMKAHIPTKYRNFTLGDINTPESEKIVKRISKYNEKLHINRRKGVGLYLHGNPGTAKSVLGCIILMDALRRRYTSYFTNVDQFLELSVSRKDEEEARELVNYLSNVDFLMVDDLGREYRDAKGFVETQMDELFRYRADHLLPTIITTNKSREELAAGNFRFLSLLHEHFIAIPFPTKDFRKKIGMRLTDEEKG